MGNIIKKILLLLLVNSAFATEATKDINFSAGRGLIYGGIVGVQATYAIAESPIEGFASLGLADMPGYTIGMHYNTTSGVRFTLGYGSTASVENSDGKQTQYTGAITGIGYLADNGWSIDLLYIDYQNAKDNLNESNGDILTYYADFGDNTGLSFGYRF